MGSTTSVWACGAGPRGVADVEALAREIVKQDMKILPSCAARTHINDIRPIAEVSQRVGRPIEVMGLLGTSPIRTIRRRLGSRSTSQIQW